MFLNRFVLKWAPIIFHICTLWSVTISSVEKKVAAQETGSELHCTWNLVLETNVAEMVLIFSVV